MRDRLPDRIAVVGAGTMGAGIVQLAATAGMTTYVYDPIPEALERGLGKVDAGLARLVAKGRLDSSESQAVRQRLRPTSELTGLATAQMVIEAAPERLDVKKELLGALGGIVDRACVLATNTSSLSVTEIAASVPEPGRVVGLHFFNPVPVMRLVEVVAGEASNRTALDAAAAVATAMGKDVIEAPDIPGFVVNRCNRPYSLEALRLLESRIATPDQIDRIARLSGRFPMGPFELMDLIGLDTNHAVAEALYRQTYGEPRFQPSSLQARKVAANHLGRKTGIGWYDYRGTEAQSPGDGVAQSAVEKPAKAVVVAGTMPAALQLRTRLAESGFVVRNEGSGDDIWLTLACDGVAAPNTGPQAILLSNGSLHQTDPTAAGFHIIPPFSEAQLIEITSTAQTDPDAYARLRELAAAIGCVCEHVRDAPGLVLGRVVCQLINEAAFLIGGGSVAPADIDLGLTLGVNHPRGPVSWAKEIGLAHVVSVLDGLRNELGEERYRAAPLLREHLAVGSDDLAKPLL